MKRKLRAEINRDRRSLCYDARISLVILAAIFLRPLRIQSNSVAVESICVSENHVDCNARNKESCALRFRVKACPELLTEILKEVRRECAYLSRNVATIVQITVSSCT